MPKRVEPMLCTLVKEPPTGDRFIYEVKWDGYRIIAYKSGNGVRLDSRGGQDYTGRYPSVVAALRRLQGDFILDGEMVVLNEEGKPDFDALQKFNGQPRGVVLYCFDLLWADSSSRMEKSLLDRKTALRELIDPEDEVLKYSEHFVDGQALFKQMAVLGLEGIVAKDSGSAYHPGERGKLWFKVPVHNRQEFVIGGWVESERRHFRTLLFGTFEKGKLIWVGHAGGGFKEKEMQEILERLRSIETKKNPFDTPVDYDGKVHWVKPELVANIRYATVTRSGRIRKPAIFEGFRNDKVAEQVTLERPVPAPKKKTKKPGSGNNAIAKRKLPTSKDSYWRTVESVPIESENELDVDGCPVTFYNLEKTIWPGVTKYDLIQHYIAVSKYILPHIKKRPLSLHLKPFGIHTEGGYIKDMEWREPACSEIFSVKRKHRVIGKRDVIDYLICNNLPTLLYIINLGCIDVNPWTTTIANIDRPDYIVIDLDPSDGDFKKAIDAARAAHEIFSKLKLKAFAKTSGKTGIHIYLPCSKFNFAEARLIAEVVCEEIHDLVPEITTTEVSVNGRGNRLYVDPNQNDYADTVAAPYSVRPFASPNVSMPIEWKELKDSLRPEAFNIKNVIARLEKKGDLFLPVYDRKIAGGNDRILKKLLP